MQLNLTTKDLWQFSTEYYAVPQNAEVLLNLQNEYGANVNLCLLLKYCESFNISISNEDITHLHNTVMEFSRMYTGQIRQLRKACKKSLEHKKNYAVLRQQLLNTELEFEKQEQTLLAEQIAQLSHLTVSEPTLTIYLKSVLLVPEKSRQSILAQLS